MWSKVNRIQDNATCKEADKEQGTTETVILSNTAIQESWTSWKTGEPGTRK